LLWVFVAFHNMIIPSGKFATLLWVFVASAYTCS